MKSAKKLIVSVVVLMVAISLAVTSTFAWFTLSATPKVEGFNVNVTTSDGLTISTTADGVYKSTLTADNIFEANSDIATLALTAVTSVDGKTFTEINGTSPAATGSFVDFTLYFKSNTKQVVKLKSDVNNTKVTSTPAVGINRVDAWQAISANTYGDSHLALEQGADILADAKDAVRISFIDGTTANVWYPNPTTGYNYDDGLNNAKEAVTAKNLAMDYYNKTEGTSFKISDTDDAMGLPSSDIYSDNLLTLDANPIAEGGFSGSLNIIIWIEGWDGDCLNSIFADTINIALQFQGVSEPATVLAAAIVDATANIDNYVVAATGAEVFPNSFWGTELNKTTYQTAITAAETVEAIIGVTAAQLRAAIVALDNATRVFNTAKTAGVKDISTLLTAINTAKVNMMTTTVSADGEDIAIGTDWVTVEVRNAYKAAIITAQEAKSGLAAVIAALDAATDTFDAAKTDGIYDLAGLVEDIEEANELIANTISSEAGVGVGVGEYWATPEAIATYTAAIAEAQAVAVSESPSYAEIEAAKTTLETATDTFELARTQVA